MLYEGKTIRADAGGFLTSRFATGHRHTINLTRTVWAPWIEHSPVWNSVNVAGLTLLPASIDTRWLKE